jgi:hypothetical protein
LAALIPEATMGAEDDSEGRGAVATGRGFAGGGRTEVKLPCDIKNCAVKGFCALEGTCHDIKTKRMNHGGKNKSNENQKQYLVEKWRLKLTLKLAAAITCRRKVCPWLGQWQDQWVCLLLMLVLVLVWILKGPSLMLCGYRRRGRILDSTPRKRWKSGHEVKPVLKMVNQSINQSVQMK